MPSRSMREHRFWEWAKAHPDQARKEHGVKSGVAEEFTQADTHEALQGLPEKVKAK